MIINVGINILAAFSIPFSTPLDTISAVKNINNEAYNITLVVLFT